MYGELVPSPGDAVGAVGAHEVLCDLDPNMAENHLELAQTLAGLPAEAERSARLAVQLDPVVREGHAMLGFHAMPGFLAWQRDESDEARGLCRAAWGSDTSAADTAVDDASVLVATDDHEAQRVLSAVSDRAWASNPESRAAMSELQTSMASAV
jgi:hypothetical protein